MKTEDENQSKKEWNHHIDPLQHTEILIATTAM